MKRMRSLSALAVTGVLGLLLSACSGTTTDVAEPNSTPVEETSTVAETTETEAGPTTIYIVRHGRTLFNEKSIVSGWSDSVLTAEGEAQGTAAGVALAGIEFGAALSSDLGRASHTAELILAENDFAVDLVLMPEIREQNYGGFDGEPDAVMWSQVMAAHGLEIDPALVESENFWDEVWPIAEDWFATTGDEEITDTVASIDEFGMAETWAQYKARMEAGIEVIADFAAANPGENVLLVAHGGAISALLALMDPAGPGAYSIDNASITTVTYEDGVFTIGDVNVAPADF